MARPLRPMQFAGPESLFDYALETIELHLEGVGTLTHSPVELTVGMKVGSFRPPGLSTYGLACHSEIDIGRAAPHSADSRRDGPLRGAS